MFAMTDPGILDRPSGPVSLTAEDYAALNFLDRMWRRLPIVDRTTGDLSLTRCLCVAFTWIVAHAIEHHHPIEWAAFWLIIAVLAAAFGKSTFGYFLTKVQLGANVAVTEARTVAENITRTITERRDNTTGIEPTA